MIDAGPGDRAAGVVPDELIDAVMNSADAGGVELLGEGGVTAELTKRILERGLNEELSAHLGYGAGDQAGEGRATTATERRPRRC